MKRRELRKGSLPFEFVALPRDVLRMPEYQRLPPNAVRLMLSLMSQYTGNNNGRLCPSWEALKDHGWSSKQTLAKARDDLLEAPFAVLTRKGMPPRKTDWIGLTWWKLNYEKSMDIDPRAFPYLNFMRMQMADPNEGRDQAQKRDVTPRNQGISTGKLILRPPEIGGQVVIQ